MAQPPVVPQLPPLLPSAPPAITPAPVMAVPTVPQADWEKAVVTGSPAPPKPAPLLAMPSVVTPASAFPSSLERQPFLRRCWSIFTDPDAFFSSLEAPKSVALAHFFLVSAVCLVIPFIASLLGAVQGDQSFMVVLGIVALPFVGLALLAVFSLFDHVLIKLLGGKGSLGTTFKVILYTTTFAIPLALPIVNLTSLFFLFYTPYALAVGVSRAHRISMLRSYAFEALVLYVFFLAIAVSALLLSTLLMAMLLPAITSGLSGALTGGLSGTGAA